MEGIALDVIGWRVVQLSNHFQLCWISPVAIGCRNPITLIATSVALDTQDEQYIQLKGN
jgi:hypothetical protein